MASKQNQPDVEKRLTYVFEDDAPLPDAALRLTDGLFLSRVPAFLLEQDDDYHLLAVEPHFSQFFRDHLSVTTLNITYPGRSDLNCEAKGSMEEDALGKANSYLLAATLHAPQFFPPFALFVTIPSVRKVCRSSRMKEFGVLDGTERAPLTADDFDAINKLYAAARQILQPGKTGRLATAITYYHQAFRTDIDWPVQFLSMMMGMEALFSHTATEISHQVSERSAFFLRENASDRECLYDRMRKFYKLRSAIAHGSTVTREKPDGCFRELLLLLRESLVKILTRPSVLTLFQSDSTEKFGKAMKNLIFHGAIAGSH